MPQPLTTAELRTEWVWLLELTWASRTFRWASGASVDITSDDGDLHYVGGLDVEWSDAAGLLSTGAGARALSLPDLWLPEDVDPPALIEAGHDLSAARGVVSLWAPGRTYEERWTLLQGRVTAPVYGGRREPIGLTIEEAPYDDRATVIPASARVSLETWPSAALASIGSVYPTVIGTPGVYTEADGTAGATAGSPAYFVHDATGVSALYLVAGHPVAATTVRLINISDGTAATLSVSSTADSLGRTVATVEAHASLITISDGDEYWCRWSTAGGGLVDDDGDLLTGAGSTMRYLLRRTSIRYDPGRTYASIQHLDRYQLSTYIDDPEVTHWDWIADHLLPILPVSVVSGPKGLRPIVYRSEVTAADAVDTITAGPDAVRTSRVQYDIAETIQVVQVEYAPRGDTGDYMRRTVLDGAGADVSASVGSTRALRQSRLRYLAPGEVPRDLRIETDVVYDDATAQLIAVEQSALRALRMREVQYDLDPGRYGALEAGDVVALTDSELSLTAQIAYVQAIDWSHTSMATTLSLIERPDRDA